MILASALPEIRHKRRRIPVAMLLSLLVPGLGQVYATRLRRGAWIFGLYTAGLAAFLATATVPPRTLGSLALYGVPVLLVVILYVFNLFDAGVGAWRVGTARLTIYNRAPVYAVAILAFFFLHHGSAVIMQGITALSTYQVGGTSNEPTVARGEKLLAWRAYYRDHEPRRGDLASYARPRKGAPVEYVIGRIIGLPGDRVVLGDGRVTLNGTPLARWRGGPGSPVESLPDGRAWQVRARAPGSSPGEAVLYVVPDGTYLVLGDNRDAAGVGGAAPVADMVPREALRDLPVVVIGSPDLRRIGVLVQSR